MGCEYGTHRPVLAVLEPISHRVLELGGGDYSTPQLLGFERLKVLVTVEDNPEWAERIEGKDPRHTVVRMAACDYLQRSFLNYDVILVDNATTLAERVATIQALAVRRPLAVVVLHDFEQDAYRAAAEPFDHTWIYRKETPWTGVAWNEGCPHRGSRLRRLLAHA